MGLSKFYTRLIPLWSFALVMLAMWIIYTVRPPLVIVTEPSFNMIYGFSRAHGKQLNLSIKLFRRVIPIQVSDSAGSEIVVEAVYAASRAPFAVIFPGLFSAAAQRYLNEFPHVPVIINEGRFYATGDYWQSSEDDAIIILTDFENDLLRAGIYAGYLAVEGGGRVVVFQDRHLTEQEREIFEGALLSQGFYNTAVYVDAGNESAAWQDISCAVVIGPATRFFELNLAIPMVIFSWVNPEITPVSVKIIFDDSVWTAAANIMEILDKGVRSFASNIEIPNGRIKGGIFSLKKTEKTALQTLISR